MERLKLTKEGIKTTIEAIASFPSKEAKLYWIKALKETEAIKGLLIIHFGLI